MANEGAAEKYSAAPFSEMTTNVDFGCQCLSAPNESRAPRWKLDGTLKCKSAMSQRKILVALIEPCSELIIIVRIQILGEHIAAHSWRASGASSSDPICAMVASPVTLGRANTGQFFFLCLMLNAYSRLCESQEKPKNRKTEAAGEGYGLDLEEANATTISSHSI
jgi:hypothetical protein